MDDTLGDQEKRETTERAGRALRFNQEADFLALLAGSDVAMKFVWVRAQDGVEVESDLFSCACYGVPSRGKDDLARLVAERMIAEGMDLRAHRTNTRHQYTSLMMAAVFCGPAVLALLLPHSDVDAVTASDGTDAAAGAEACGNLEAARFLRAYRLSQAEHAALIAETRVVPELGPKDITTRTDML